MEGERMRFRFTQEVNLSCHIARYSNSARLLFIFKFDFKGMTRVFRTGRRVAVTEPLEVGCFDRKLSDVINVIGMRLGVTFFEGIIFTQVNVARHTAGRGLSKFVS